MDTLIVIIFPSGTYSAFSEELDSFVLARSLVLVDVCCNASDEFEIDDKDDSDVDVINDESRLLDDLIWSAENTDDDEWSLFLMSSLEFELSEFTNSSGIEAQELDRLNDLIIL